MTSKVQQLESTTTSSELITLQNQEYIYKQIHSREVAKDNSRSLLLEFLKQVRPGFELWRFPVPCFLLQPMSLLERLTHFFEPNEILNEITNNDPEQRFLSITSWLISTWRRTPKKSINGSKPYNPILGELFKCSWEHKDGSVTNYIAEQVSHHPPVSVSSSNISLQSQAVFVENKKRKFSVDAWLKPKTGLGLNSLYVEIKDVWYSIKLHEFEEEYEISQPSIIVKNVFWGKREIDVYNKLTVSCKKTGYSATIEFTDGSIHGVVSHGNTQVFKYEGKVCGTVELISVQSKKKKVVFDASQIQPEEMIVRPVYQQEQNESRRNWHKLTWALMNDDEEDAIKQKIIIEDREREIRKKRQSEGITWKPKYFEFDGKNWIFKNKL